MKVKYTFVNPDSVKAEFRLIRIKLKLQMISYIGCCTVILNKKLQIIRNLANLDDFVCQIESGLTEVYCIG